MITIMLVRQLPSQLVPGEMHALFEVLRDTSPEYRTTNPQSQAEHARDCERIKPTLVLIPYTYDVSILSQAMEKGFRHIRISAGEVTELCPSKPGLAFSFKPFKV